MGESIVIDDNRQAGFRNGQFLLLGSAALDLMRHGAVAIGLQELAGLLGQN
jgi:hypothetical protein